MEVTGLIGFGSYVKRGPPPPLQKMFSVDNFGAKIYEYKLSTTWSLSTTSYLSRNFSTSGQTSSPQAAFFKSDGTKMYLLATGTVYQYSLSTAWNIATASYDSVSFSVAQGGFHKGIAFKSDGTKMYICNISDDRVYQYSLSGAWDLSTASYDSVFIDVSSQTGSPNGIAFKSDGTKMYISGASGGGAGSVFQYSLSSAWNVGTATYDSVSLNINSQSRAGNGIAFKSDGTKMAAVDSVNNAVYQYTLSSGWDLSSASYDSVSFSLSSQNTAPTKAFFTDGEVTV